MKTLRGSPLFSWMMLDEPIGRGCAITTAANITNNVDKNDFFIEFLFSIDSL